MPQVERSVLVLYSAQQMFDLVERVEDYPKFLPWCSGAEVSHRDVDSMQATVHIGFKGVHQKFTTKNRHEKPHRIEMALVDGPFSDLHGEWRFQQLGEHGCKVQFNLRYEFSNRLLAQLIGPVFNHIAGSFVDSFTRRAEEIYR